MKAVGIRELKNRLSEYIRQAHAGEDILVTDRGEVVAQLIAPGPAATPPHVPAALADLARRGLVVLGAPNDAALYPPFQRRLRSRSAADLLSAERGLR